MWWVIENINLWTFIKHVILVPTHRTLSYNVQFLFGSSFLYWHAGVCHTSQIIILKAHTPDKLFIRLTHKYWINFSKVFNTWFYSRRKTWHRCDAVLLGLFWYPFQWLYKRWTFLRNIKDDLFSRLSVKLLSKLLWRGGWGGHDSFCPSGLW